MKKLTTSLAVLLLGTVMSHGANPPPGDILLGFQETGNTNNVEFDLGSASTLIADEGTGATIDLSSMFSLSGVTGTYGAISVINPLQFGILGAIGNTSKPFANGVVVPRQTVFVGSSSTSNVPQEQSNQSLISGSEGSDYTAYGSGSQPTGETGNQIGSSVPTSTNGSYTAVAGADGQYGGVFPFSTQDTFTGSGSQTLALYEVVPNANAGNASLIGNLSLNDTTGALTFTATSAPEPSTYLMMGMGLVVVAVAARRRLVNNA